MQKGFEKGEKHFFSKLTEGDIFLIRSAYSMGASQSEIARHFGITAASVSHIVNRLTWSHIH